MKNIVNVYYFTYLKTKGFNLKWSEINPRYLTKSEQKIVALQVFHLNAEFAILTFFPSKWQKALCSMKKQDKKQTGRNFI